MNTLNLILPADGKCPFPFAKHILKRIWYSIFLYFLCLNGPALLQAETDLNVTLIERTPRYNYDAAKNNPEPGDTVTFHGHIINWSDTSQSPDYQWLIDDVPYGQGTLTAMVPGQESVITIDWQWLDGNHTVSLIVDPDNTIAESSEANNEITDRTNALIAGFWVEQSVYDYFHQYQHELGIGSNSWQDWIQRQMAKQNELYEQAVWPLSPQGVLDRVRIDKIIVVPDGALPLNGGLPSNHPDTSDKTVDLMWGFAATLLNGDFYANHTSKHNNHFYIEQPLIHELGHARYLIDCYGFDVHNTAGHHAVQIWEGDTYVAGSEYLPFIAWGEVLYYNHSGGVMSGPYGFAWSPYEAAALNLIAGRRPVCGNYNAPCNIGEFLQDLPEQNHVRFVDTDGQPWVGADVRIYQAAAASGWYGKTFDNIPDQQYYTDDQGYVHLPRNPFNPGGEIIHTYGHSNAVFIFRIAFGAQIWYRFMEVSDYNMQYWQGNTDEAYYTIELEGDNFIDLTPPTDPCNLRAAELACEAAVLVWDPSTDDIGVLGYHVFRDNVQIATVSEPTFTDMNLTCCTSYSYTVTAFDTQHESGPSAVCVLAVPGPTQDPDFTDNAIVDLDDLLILCNHWLHTGCGVTGDISGDAAVNLRDVDRFARQFTLEMPLENWPMKQADMHNTGRAAWTVPAARLNDTFFDTILWQKPSPGSPGNGRFSAGSMSFFNGVGPDGEDVVVGGYHWPKGVQGMDRHTGALLWNGNTAGGETIGRITPAFSNDGAAIYVTNDATDGELMAFATAVGPSSYWHSGADSESRLHMQSPTVGPDGRVWLHNWNDRPYGGTDHGDRLTQTWAAATGVSACYSDPALFLDNGRLLVVSGGRTNRVNCWDGQTGDELWSASTHHQAPVDASATIDPRTGHIYIPAGFEDIYVIGLDKTGQPLWAQPAMQVYDWQSGINHPQRAQAAGCLSHDGRTFYFQTNSSHGDGALYAVNTADGSLKWTYPTAAKGWEIHSSCPIVTRNGVIVVGNNENDTFYAIHDTPGGPVLLDTLTVDGAGNALASATLSPDGILYLPLRIVWNTTNGDGDSPTQTAENLFTAISLQ